MERAVLKKRVKGLAALMLAVVMMYGSSISALAASYQVAYNIYHDNVNDEWVYELLECTLTEGTIITSEDNIGPRTTFDFYLSCKIDGTDKGRFCSTSGNTIYFSNFLEEGETYKVTSVASDLNDLKIEVQTIVNSGENGGGNGVGNEGNAGDAVVEETREEFHEHNWEWEQTKDATVTQDGIETLCCTGCGEKRDSREIANSSFRMFCKLLTDKINNAPENATIEMTTDIWCTLPKSVIEALKARRDETVNLTLKYQNQKYRLTVPAGYDMSVLEEADWYGVLYLNQFFGVAEK